MEVQRSFLDALQSMSTAMCAVRALHRRSMVYSERDQATCKQCTLPYQRTAVNFLRRYKWAFKPEYDDLAPALPLPDLRQFAPDVEHMLQVRIMDAAHVRTHSVSLGRAILSSPIVCTCA